MQLTSQPPSTYGGLWSQSMSCCSERLVMFLLAILFRHSATATDAKLQQQPHCGRRNVRQPRQGGSKHNADANCCFLLEQQPKPFAVAAVQDMNYTAARGGGGGGGGGAGTSFILVLENICLSNSSNCQEGTVGCPATVASGVQQAYRGSSVPPPV